MLLAVKLQLTLSTSSKFIQCI